MSSVTDALSQEHQTVLKKLEKLEGALTPLDETVVRETLSFFDDRLVLHRRKEEEVLFPALGKHIGTETGPIACMLHEHRDEKEKIEVIRAALEKEPGEARDAEIRGACLYILELLRNHIAKEDNILFPLAEQALDPAEKEPLHRAMDEIGYCYEEAGA